MSKVCKALNHKIPKSEARIETREQVPRSNVKEMNGKSIPNAMFEGLFILTISDNN